MQFRLVTLFPQMLGLVRDHGVTARAVRRNQVSLEAINPRDFADDVHRTVDDRPYGGGPGMVMKIEPLAKAVAAASQGLKKPSRVVVMSPQGPSLDAAKVADLARLNSLILVCGRYEGIDERFVAAFADETISLGDFVLSGGELAALAVVDAVTRQLPGVLGHDESAEQDSFANGLLDCPQFTRPEAFSGRCVPPVLLSGDHAAIQRWRLKMSLGRTWLMRPDLLKDRKLTKQEQILLDEYKRDFECGKLDVSEKP